MKRKLCLQCQSPSVPGLRKGVGYCQYHWDVRCFGQSWADQCREAREAKASDARRFALGESARKGTP